MGSITQRSHMVFRGLENKFGETKKKRTFASRFESGLFFEECGNGKAEKKKLKINFAVSKSPPTFALQFEKRVTKNG
jgi:hypothetical protein